MPSDLRVIHLKAENFRRLRAVDITPDENVVVITGENAAGKSSVLDAIWSAIAGADALKRMGTTQPVRHGEDEAMVEVDLGDLKVTRRWDVTKRTTNLIVESAEGARFQKPQQILDGLMGRLSFDPLAFSTMKPADQLAELMSLVELPFDPDVLAGQRLTLFEERTEVGRRVKSLTAQVELIPEVEGVAEEKVSAAGIGAEMRAAQEVIDSNRQARTDAVTAEDRAQELRDRVAQLLTQLADARATLDTAEIAATAHAQVLAELPDDPDLTEFETRMESIDQQNLVIEAQAERRRLVAALKAASEEQSTLTQRIEKIDEDRREGVAAATMPVPGLDFGDGHVIYNGVPFHQASAAEQLRVSVGMAMAANPNIRIIRVENASLLDDTNMAVISDMARESGYQVWLEVVGDDDNPAAILIEDGAVVEHVSADL